MSKTLLVSLMLLIGCTKDEIVPFHHALDNAIVDKMMEYNIPGLSLAVVKDEKLVYANSYGFAIKESQEATSNDHLYRLASISKVITAVSILKLVSEGTLSLDQTVFGTNGVLEDNFVVPPDGSMINQITIRHLIEHKSGWTNNPYDPVFSVNVYTQSDLIQNLVTVRSLSYTPGTTYLYFNMGYVILGRIIEKVTGETYEDYIVQNILNPIGITKMKIGGDTFEEKIKNEVKYYNQNANDELPYSMDLKRMDAAAGWISSASDLARLIVRIDKGIYKPDIIPEQILSQFYFDYASWYHTGFLPGNACVIARLNNSFSIVVLTNSDHSHLYETIKQKVLETNGWPDIDLF